MTEPCEDGNSLVRVRAQVMVRDDSTGGWVPMGCGGLSYVTVRKRDVACELEQLKYEYLIIGQRVPDKAVVLSCVIKRDFEYNKVMPTFHHWKTGESKFGLTFQTAADARAFDKGLRTAVDELLDGISDPLLAVQPRHAVEVGDDDVFMTLNLPVDHGDSRSSSGSSRGSRHPTPPQEPPRRSAKLGSDHESPPSHAEHYPFVQLSTGPQKPTLSQSGSIKKEVVLEPAKVDLLQGGKRSAKEMGQLCHYCRQRYHEEENERGSCRFAPDCMGSVVKWVACMSCANAMLYNCMSDSEGEFAEEPCDCSPEDGCGKRWLGLALLSLLVPCLWLYPPLRACQLCCMRCGLSGGRHRPAS